MKVLKQYRNKLHDDIAVLNWQIKTRKAHTNDEIGLDDATIAKLIQLRNNLKTALENCG